MRRKSAIDIAKRLDRIKRARRMTPDERLLACANISRLVLEFQRAGEQHRRAASQKLRS